MRIIHWIVLSICFVLPLSALTETCYPLTAEPIDVVIPCCGKDLDTLELCIYGIRKHGKNIRRIIVVSKEKFTHSAEWFDEQNYPFSKETVALELFHNNQTEATRFLSYPSSRIGWIYQQLLKLYAPFTIPGISANVLVLDADVVFLNPVEFMTKKGEPYLTIAHEYHQPYFAHMERLLPGLKRVQASDSGVAHHMLFQYPILNDLMQMIAHYHQTEPWKAICRCIDHNHVHQSSFSEYEIYFNFALLRTKQAHTRSLSWINSTTIDKKALKGYKKQGVVYAACHSYNR